MSCRVGITLGDQAGIGPEIVRAALASVRLPSEAEYSIIGSAVDCSLGQPSAETARAAAQALEEAAQLALRPEIDAVVTGPIHKARMYEIGFKFPGQTEFFADRCGISNFAMLLTGGKLTVALVTVHVPLREVPEALTTDEIVRVGLLLENFLRRRGIAAPRIAVAGLNPHAGEHGLFGMEDEEVLRPAVSACRGRGIDVSGPWPADTLFVRAQRGEFDVVIACYHDQGLIPVKLLAFGHAVNVTLGLPIIRTSVDHGTAFDIAGTGRADPESLIAAVLLAAKLAARSSGRH
jgi:4-hydroxythreonine-4-phosphate dehydrogenase